MDHLSYIALQAELIEKLLNMKKPKRKNLKSDLNFFKSKKILKIFR